MGLFRRFANAVARFMYGRNGMDQLNLLLVVCVLVLYLVSGLLDIEEEYGEPYIKIRFEEV